MRTSLAIWHRPASTAPLGSRGRGDHLLSPPEWPQSPAIATALPRSDTADAISTRLSGTALANGFGLSAILWMIFYSLLRS